MPDRKKVDLILARRANDLVGVRIPGIDKPLDQLTISELVQLRPGQGVEDSYEVNAVTDNASITTSSALEELGRIKKEEIMRAEVNEIRTASLRTHIADRLRTIDR